MSYYCHTDRFYCLTPSTSFMLYTLQGKTAALRDSNRL